jgi:hypothetical protein
MCIFIWGRLIQCMLHRMGQIKGTHPLMISYYNACYEERDKLHKFICHEPTNTAHYVT